MRAWPIVCLVALACQPDAIVGGVSGASPITVEPTTVAIYGPTAAVPDQLLLRSVDIDGLSSGPATVNATLDGAPVEVEVDGRGYALLDFDGPAAVTLGGIGQPAAVLGSSPWTSAWPPAHLGVPEARFVESASGGVLVGAGFEVWWTGHELPAHPVARFEDEVEGLRAVTIDDDGVVDALAWSGGRVVLLRGRTEGGASFGFGLEEPGWTVRGADLADVDDDGLRDLVVAWSTPAGPRVQIWAGDGAWGFEPLYERRMPGVAYDLTIASDRGEGPPVITALTDEGTWMRLTRDSRGGWILTGPPIPLDAQPGSSIRSVGDYNESGADNLLFAQPRVPVEERDIQIWSLDGDNPSFLRTGAPGAHLAFADLFHDGLRSIMTLDEERNFLRYLRFDDGVYRNAEAGETFGFGPFGAGAGGEEASMDLLVGEEAWAWYPGAWVDGDEGGWTLPLPEGEAFPLSIAGAMYTADDGRGLTFVEAGTALRAGWIEVDALGPVVSELVSVGTVEQEILDAAVCGDRVWVLFEDELVLARLGDDVLGRREVHSPLAVACRAERGAVLDDAGISVLDDALDVLTTEEAAGALGIALYDDEVERCQGRCRLWSSGGAVVVAEALGDEVLVRDLDGEALLALPGGGADLSLGAVAGDGEVDLLWRWGRGFVGAARLVDGQVGVIGSVHVPASVSGPPVAIGGELWFRDHGALRGPPLAD